MILQRTPKGNWAYCQSQLGKDKLADTSQGMKDRTRRGTEDQEHFKSGAWFAENFNCVDERILAARGEFSPIIRYAEKAVQAHKAGQEFYLTSQIVDASGKPYSELLNKIAEADAKKLMGKKRVADLGKAVTHNVPTDSFADDPAIVFLARGEKPANRHGLFLKNELHLPEVTVYHMPLIAQDYARGFWLYRLDESGGSDFDCYNRSLSSDDSSVFRVRRDVVTAESGSQKFSEQKVRILVPSFAEVRKFAKQYVSPRDKADFEKGLRNLFEKGNK
jgi:hypothetical protein